MQNFQNAISSLDTVDIRVSNLLEKVNNQVQLVQEQGERNVLTIINSLNEMMIHVSVAKSNLEQVDGMSMETVKNLKHSLLYFETAIDSLLVLFFNLVQDGIKTWFF